MKNFIHLLSYICFRVFTFFLSLIPRRWLIKIISSLLTLFQYRKKVIENNLRRCFPKKSNSEITNLIYQNYTYLGKVIVELIFKGEIPIRFENADLLRNSTTTDGIILLMGHIENWEALGKNIGNIAKLDGYGIYKPLSNPYFDKMFIDLRTDEYAHPLPMKEIFKTIINNRKLNKPSIYLLVADQSPSSTKKAVLTDFFGQQTYFIDGTKRLMEEFDFDFLFVENTIDLDGTYVGTVSKLIKDKTITQQYATLLESNIRKNIPHWLWSHKRWKLHK